MKAINSTSVSMLASVLFLTACGKSELNETNLYSHASSSSFVSSSSDSSSLSLETQSSLASSASHVQSSYDASSMLGLRLGNKSVFPISMTVIDHDEKIITVKVATKIGTEKPFDKKSLVVSLNGDQVYLDQSNEDPYLFDLPVSLAKSMLSSKPSIIQFHVEKDRYYEVDFSMSFENSFRSALDNLLKSK